MPPIMIIRLSPTTTTPRAEACRPIPEKFDTVRNTLLTREPTMMSTTTTGRRAASLTSDTARAWRLLCCSVTSAATLLLTSPPGLAATGGLASFSLLTWVMLSPSRLLPGLLPGPLWRQ